jgi:hypothetical protein
MIKKLNDPLINAELKKCKHFDEIFTIVYELRIEGFGSLAVYDTALRLGAFFGYYPEVIYLHQGALVGANELLGKEEVSNNSKYFCGNPDYSYITQGTLPHPLDKLESYHIENFLCINKNKLNKARLVEK